jgi:hypothetical protein
MTLPFSFVFPRHRTSQPLTSYSTQSRALFKHLICLLMNVLREIQLLKKTESKIDTTELARDGDPFADWAYTRRFEAA